MNVRAHFRLAGKCFVRVPPQQLVQISVATDNRQRSNRRWKNYLISIGIKFNISPKKGFEFHRRASPRMSDFQSERRYSTVCDLSAYAHQRNQPKLDLLPIGASVYVQVVDSDVRRSIQFEPQVDP